MSEDESGISPAVAGYYVRPVVVENKPMFELCRHIDPSAAAIFCWLRMVPNPHVGYYESMEQVREVVAHLQREVKL